MDYKFRYKITDFTRVKDLGKGQFGMVFLAKHKERPNFLVAVKQCSLRISEKAKFYLFREIDVLGSLDHPNINKFYGYDTDEDNEQLYMFLEYCNGGDLQNTLDNYKKTTNKPLSQETCQYLLKQIVSGLQALHNKNFIHRDLKPGNFLLHFDNETDLRNKNLLHAHLKIADFGFAKNLAVDELAESVLGTPFFADPRIFLSKNERYGKEADVWSLGVISFQLLTGTLPFLARDLSSLQDKINLGSFSISKNVKLSEESVSFIQCSLQDDFKLRWDVNDLARHYFLVRRIENFTDVLEKRKDQGGDINLNIYEMEKSLVDRNVMKAHMLDESIKPSVPEKLEESRGQALVNEISRLMISRAPKKQEKVKSKFAPNKNFVINAVLENKLKKCFADMNEDFIYFKPKIAPGFPYEPFETKELQLDIRTDLNSF